MNEKEKLLRDAFEFALNTEEVAANTTDNADEQIQAAMINYILKDAVNLNSEQIKEYIDGQTALENALLEESFEQVSCSVRDKKKEELTEDAEIRAHIQDEMQEYFRQKQAAIRHRRIEIYVNDQVKKQAEKQGR